MRVLDMYHGDVMVFLVCLNRMLISYYISVPGYFHVMTTLYSVAQMYSPQAFCILSVYETCGTPVVYEWKDEWINKSLSPLPSSRD